MVTCSKCGFGNQETARFCSNCGNSLEAARPIEGERRFATVLFADVARSTAIAERLDPEDWALVMNGAFGFMNASVSRYGGTVSRLMGDAILALFGAPIAHEDDAERAVRAGLEIQAAARAHAGAVRQRYGVDFELRVGINTGTAVLAFVGDAVKTEYTAMGDAANVAARLQSAAAPGTVLISADTYRLVHAVFDVQPLGPLDMKGKEAPVKAYEVTGVRAVPGQARGLEGLGSPLVGRDAQFEALRAALDDLDKGTGAVAVIVGEAGLGKSRLIAELRKRHEERAQVGGWLETRAISYGQAIPYYPWRTLGRQIIGAGEMDGAEAVREKLGAWAKRLELKGTDLPFYETLLAVEGEASRSALAALPGDAVVDGMSSAVINALKSAMRSDRGGPRVLVLDDLHWSDGASVELIAQVATLTAFEPLLLICALRPDRRAAAWGLIDRLPSSLAGSFHRIDLEPLDAGATQTLLGNLLTVEDMPEAVRRRILERSEGNPFYLEEVLRSLIDAGQITREGDRWHVTGEIKDEAIPETLAGVLSARIDRLPEITKKVAQTASVIGRVFQHRLLETVCRTDPSHIEHIEPHLATLSYEQLVREKAREPEREFIFKHALTCDAAYSLLLKSKRREMHGLVGNALETLFADRRDEYAAVLAHHFDEAGDVPRAIHYARRAADSARDLFASREEVEQRERVLALVSNWVDAPPEARIDAITEWTAVRHRLNQYDGVLEKLKEAVELARPLGDDRRLAAALSWTGNIYMVTGFPIFGFPYVMEARDIAEKLGDERMMLLPLFAATWSMVDRDPSKAITALDQVIDLARKQNAFDVLGHAMTYRAVSLARLGRFAEARKEVEAALPFALRAGSPVKEADIHIGAGMAYYELGDIEKGLEHSRIGAEGAFRVNGAQCACAGYLGIGRGKFEQSKFDDALTNFDLSLSFAGGPSMETFANQIKGMTAAAEIEKGQEPGIFGLREAIRHAEDFGDLFVVATMRQRLARALLRQGSPEEASSLLEQAVAYYRERAMLPYLQSAMDLMAEIDDCTGRFEEARRHRAEAQSLKTRIDKSDSQVDEGGGPAPDQSPPAPGAPIPPGEAQAPRPGG